MIRIAHFSDLHYGTKNLVEADRCFGAAIDRAIALGGGGVLSGDATDHALDLHAPAAERLVAQVRRLADHCPVLMLQGTFSHEPPGTLAIFKLLGGGIRCMWPSVSSKGPHCPGTMACFDGLVLRPTAGRCSCPVLLRPDEQGGGGRSGRCGGCRTGRGRAPGPPAARLRADQSGGALQGVPTIGVSHGTVFGCVSEHGVPMAGFDHEFTTGRCSVPRPRPSCSGTSTGIRHGSRKAGQGGSASPIPARSVVFITARKGEGFSVLGNRRRPGALHAGADARVPNVDIVFEGKPDLDALRAAVAQQDIAGAFVRVRWTVADEDRHQVDRAAIERLLEGAAETKLEGRIVPVVRTRAAGISQLANLADKVRVWAQVTEARAEPLLACLQALASQEPEAIAERVLRGQEVPDGESRTADQAHGRS
jgi:exonuclease SbcD